MSSTYDIDLLREAGEEALMEYVDFLVEVLEEEQGPHGETVGDVQMTPGSRIAQFILDAQSGQLDALAQLNPEFARQRAQQYIEDVRNSPAVAHTFEAPKQPAQPLPPPTPITGPNIWPRQAGLSGAALDVQDILGGISGSSGAAA